MHKSGILFLLLFFCAAITQAQKKPFNKQKDTVNRAGDTTSVLKPFQPKANQPKEKVYHPDSTHNPHKAVIKSLMLPGFGQIYNHHYWKLPLVYGSFVGLGYSFWYAQTNYKFYLHQVQVLTTGHPELLKQRERYKGLTTAQLIPYKDFFHRNRDLTIIATIAFWGIQAIDAYIDAKFQHSYTMDNNLSFKLCPSMLILSKQTYAYAGFVPGLKATIGIR